VYVYVLNQSLRGNQVVISVDCTRSRKIAQSQLAFH